MPRGGLQDHLILCLPDVLQKFVRKRGKLQAGRVFARFTQLAVAVGGFDQTEFADIAGQSHLRGVNVHFLQRSGEFLLSGDASAADQFENLSVPEAFRHERFASRTRTAINAAATVSGPVPPSISRVFMPSRGSSRLATSGVNSGANCASVSAFQSAGFFPARTLSSTRRPTI